MTRSILVIDESQAAGNVLRGHLAAANFVAEVAVGGRAAQRRLRARPYDAVLLSAETLGVSAHTLLAGILTENRARAVLFYSATADVAQAVEAIQAGAKDYLTLPLDRLTVVTALKRALKHQDPAKTLEQPRKLTLAAWRSSYADNMVGEHPLLLEALETIRRISETDCDVLITGASGTGKELVAHAIHQASRRRLRPFVALNCAAIPKELMESEIFGHARGAFTGATERRAGKFEAAHQGTIFLDEVGEMELSLQSKLLRVIQEREITPVGESKLIKVDVRMVAATNQDLEQLCRDRSFREDLYYRLNVVPVHLPTLKARQSDIPLLTGHFIQRANRRHNRNICGIDADATALLCSHSWPGNIRELHNVIERIAVLKRDERLICPADLPATLRPAVSVIVPKRLEVKAKSVPLEVPDDGLDINEALATMEITLTRNALSRANGNKKKAAELLGLKRTTLVERLKKLNIGTAAQSA